MGAAIAVVWGIVLFVLGCIMVVAFGGILATLVVYTVKSIREGLRESREEREDRAALVSAPPARVAKVTPILRNPE